MTVQVLGDQPLRLGAGAAVCRAAGGQDRPAQEAGQQQPLGQQQPGHPLAARAVRGPDRCRVPAEHVSGALSPVRVLLLIDPRSPVAAGGGPGRLCSVHCCPSPRQMAFPPASQALGEARQP